MSATTFTKPDLPASVVDFFGEQSVSLPPSTNTTVAIMGTHNWGPVGIGTLYQTLDDFTSSNGGDLTPGAVSVIGALQGMGLTDAGGAGGVIFYRLARSDRASTRTFRNTATSPADAFRLDAIYTGSRGNDISVVIEGDPLDETKSRMRVLFKGATAEQYSYVSTDITNLAALINGRPSRYVRASSLVTGTGLAATAGTSLAGGDDGASVTSDEYTAAQADLEYRDFGLFAPTALTDASIKVQLAAWQSEMASDMRPFRLVFGGSAGEDIDDAIGELTTNPSLRDPHVIRFAVGTYHDNLLDLDLSTAQLAPRVAGILAARGERAALTRAEMSNLTQVGTGATRAELVAGRDAGLTMLRRVTSDVTELAISQGVSTFVSQTTEGMPYDLYSEPRLIGLMDRITRQLSQWGDENVVGDLPVTDDTRNLVRTEVLGIMSDLESTGLAEPGSSSVAVNPPPPDLPDAVPYTFRFIPSRTANYMIGKGTIS